jgi:hypothetical protein
MIKIQKLFKLVKELLHNKMKYKYYLCDDVFNSSLLNSCYFLSYLSYCFLFLEKIFKKFCESQKIDRKIS